MRKLIANNVMGNFILLIIFFLLNVSGTFAQTDALPKDEPLVRVRIETSVPDALKIELENAGFYVLPESLNAFSLEVVASSQEQKALEELGLELILIEQGHPLNVMTLELAVPGSYQDLQTMIDRMNTYAQAAPEIAQVVNLTQTYGLQQTFEGNDIYAVKLSDNVSIDEDEPAILLLSGHHSNEIVNPVITLYALEQFTTNYGSDPDITGAVDNYEIWIVPICNPDGYNHVFNTDNLWRKNRRTFSNGTGVDINRNYPQGWHAPSSGSTNPSSNTHKGPEPASETETKTIIALSRDRHFAKVINYHSSGQETVYGYNSLSHPFSSWMEQEASAISTASGYNTATRAPSAEGEEYQWQYGQMGAYAYLIETATSQQPSYESALAEAELVWPGIVWVINRPTTLSGHVKDAVTQEALEATIDLLNVTFTNGETNSSNGRFGRYHLFVPPGQYDVQFSAPGYETQTWPVNVINNDFGDQLEVELSEGTSIVTKDIGHTSVFSNSTTTANRRAMPFVMSEDGTIGSISMYHEGGSGNMILAVYDGASSPQNRLGMSAETAVKNSAGWQTIDLIDPVFISSETKIWLVWVYENNPGIRYETGTPGRVDAGEGWSGGMPDPFGSSTTANYTYSIYATYIPGPESVPPTADFTYATNDLSVDFTDRSSSGDYTIVSWLWDFGDNLTSTKLNPTHDYLNYGVYNATLTVTDDNNISDVVSKQVVVASTPPTADFTFIINDLSVGFTDQSTGDHTIVSWLWDFDDNLNSTELNPIHNYSSYGTYNVTLTVTDDNNISDVVSKVVVVTSASDFTPPSPDPMTWDIIPNATSSTSISMTATTATDPSSVEYYFECISGGGNTSDWQDSPTYEDIGLIPDNQYTYRVQARDKSVNQNLTDWSTSASAMTPLIPENVGNTEVFSSSTTTANRRAMPFVMSEDGIINSISMYHEGGSGNMILAVYDGANSPNVRLGVCVETSVNGSAGWQTIDLIDPVFVSAGANIWLTWVYQTNPGIRYETGTPGRVDAGEGWSGRMPGQFGNSTTADYIYSIYATYIPGPESIPPTADFIYTINDLNVDFTDQSAPGDHTIVSWVWDFDDGSTSTEPNPTHDYLSYDAYNVTLTVTDDNNKSNTVSKEIVVASTSDFTPPLPDPMTWDVLPNATSSTSISMTATTATDLSGVEYYFECTSGGGNTSGWQDSPTYENIGLIPDNQYTYRVQARDKSANQNPTDWSTSASAATPLIPEHVGHTEVFSSSTTTANRRAMPFVMAEDGTINSISMYHEGGSGNMILAVYDGADSPQNRFGMSAETAVKSSTGWQTIDLIDPVFISSGTKIWLTWVYQNNPGISYKSGTPGRVDAGEGWFDGMPGQFGTSSTADYVYSIYATYIPGPESIPPTADFIYTIDDLNVDFTDQSTPGDHTIISWLWDFDDGLISTELNPAHDYLSYGVYNVTLTVTDDNNKSNIVSKEVIVASTSDFTPPSPDPMTWDILPNATSSTSISMTATTATDPSGVEYYFECTSGGGNTSGWQDSPIYEDMGLQPETIYTYRVKARDKSYNQNGTGWASEESASTNTPLADVEILGSWISGTSHTTVPGSNRALLFFAYAEDNNSNMDLSSVSYGGQPMTKVVEKNVGTGYRTYVVAYILNEAGIKAATSGTFSPSWTETPSRTPAYSSVFVQNVNQTNSIGDFAGNSGTSGSTLTTVPLVNNIGDMLIVAGACGNTGTYSVNNNFIEAIELTPESADGVAGYKTATGIEEIPSVTHSNVNRQVVIGFTVLKL